MAAMGEQGSAQPRAPMVLEASSLTRTLGEQVKQVILQGIDLQVRRGEFVALTGPSGSGKSTLLYLLGVLDRPTSGRLLVDGIDASLLDDNERAGLRNTKFGFVFQFHFLLPEFSVLENVMIPMLRRKVAREEARAQAERTLSNLGLGELTKRYPGELSGGQQQRVSIARALGGAPTILLADEPTGNLDSKNGEIVVQLFEQLNHAQGMTIVMVTHDPAFAARASRQVVLKDGKILRDEHQRSTVTAGEIR
jgi:lipoprotein-releasing system ATP-binding protein